MKNLLLVLMGLTATVPAFANPLTSKDEIIICAERKMDFRGPNGATLITYSLYDQSVDYENTSGGAEIHQVKIEHGRDTLTLTHDRETIVIDLAQATALWTENGTGNSQKYSNCMAFDDGLKPARVRQWLKLLNIEAPNARFGNLLGR